MNEARNLVIVESPAKAKTIEKILGSEFKVLSSYGHIRDLAKTDLGVDIAHNFKPNYIVSDDKRQVVSRLKSAVKQADTVWLASDDDREGEAIAWHLYEVLGLKNKPTKRIVFHEITPTAIKKAIQTPREININLVDAQQARRILDRIVGFELSPLLWKRIMPSLSAGRVQSVAVRLICERETEIRNFTPTVTYRAQAALSTQTGKIRFRADANSEFSSANKAIDFLKANAPGTMTVIGIEKKKAKRSPAAPFTTSTLQQEAARKLGFPVSTTMRVAQKLYEEGLITYMRTDSVNLSPVALKMAEDINTRTWGAANHQRRIYKTKSKGAQEAHEAIRPTNLAMGNIPGDEREARLYRLILSRTLASQMADATFEKTEVLIENSASGERFIASGEVLLSEGFLAAYNYKSTAEEQEDEEEGSVKRLPKLAVGDTLKTYTYSATEHYSNPPARYTEASLVRRLEELGIGRPSTYAPTVQTILNREYVTKGQDNGTLRIYKDYLLDTDPYIAGNEPQLKERREHTGATKGKLLPTDIGMVVNDFLVANFPKILSYDFTANIEEQFDKIAGGKLIWTEQLNQFYQFFHPTISKVLESDQSDARGERELGTDPASGKTVKARIGRYGPLVQIGETGDAEKPRYASLRDGQSIHTITLEEALKLFDFPRTLGAYEGSEVVVAIGRFGPYLKHGGENTSVPRAYNPSELTIEEAIAIIEQKREADRKATLRTYPEDESLRIKLWRKKPVIEKGKERFYMPARIKKPETLSYSEAIALFNELKGATSKKSTKRTATKRKSASAKK